MAYHIRKQIREKIKTLLEAENLNVFFDDPDIVADSVELPAVFINSISEDVEYTTIGNPRNQERTYRIVISAYVKSNKNLIDKVDEMSYTIENTLSKNKAAVNLDGLVNYTSLNNTEFNFNLGTDQNIGEILLSYDIIYRTIENEVDKKY